MRWNKEINKTLAIIESCNTLKQLSVAVNFAKQCVKSFGVPDSNFAGHWEAIFHLTIDERVEEIRAENPVEFWHHNPTEDWE